MDSKTIASAANCLAEQVGAISDFMANIEIDTTGFDKLEVEQDKVDWYHDRFERCKEDGVPDAITCYLQRLQRDNVNDLTRVLIIKDSLQYSACASI